MDVKWIIIPSFFLACAALGCSKSCTKSDECGKDQCCVTLAVKSRRGTCHSLSRERDSCSMPGDVIKQYGAKYLIACPCQEGLTCTTGRSKELVYGPMAVMALKCRKQTGVPNKPVEKPVAGEDGVEIIYEDMDGGKISEEEIINKAIVETKKAK